MTEASSRSFRLLRAAAVLARWALRLVVAFGLLLALAWGGLHGWIVPRVHQWQGSVERYVQQALGVPLQIAGIAAYSDGLFPTLELSGIRLLDAQGKTALVLPRVLLTLSPQALLRLGVARIAIEGLELEVQRDSQGQWLVAGMLLDSGAGEGSHAALDWLLEQSDIALHAGTLRWTDAQAAGSVPVVLTQVEVTLRNAGRQHTLQLAATPPQAWGSQVTVQGDFRAPLFFPREVSGQPWQQWSGRLFVQLQQFDASAIRASLPAIDMPVERGRGTVRAWLDLQRGQVQGITADVALADIVAKLGPELAPWTLRQLQGRIEGRRLGKQGGITLATRNLEWATDSGLHWPKDGDVTIHYSEKQSSIAAKRLDLALLTWLAQRLPLDAEVHQALARYAPQGQLEDFQADWTGPLAQAAQYQARGKLHGLALGQVAADGQPTELGLRGGSVSFQLTQVGGSADVGVKKGALLLPGIFADAVVPLQSLVAKVAWSLDGGRVAVTAENVRFANADAQGDMQLAWHMDEGQEAALPGVLDLSGRLRKADATRVHRYLPLVIPAEARHYVRDAIRTGSADSVHFRVKGPLRDMPFSDGTSGEFRIATKVKDVTYAYVPPVLQAADEKPWPVLTQLGGELIFAGAGMEVRDASGSIEGRPQLRLDQVQARIADFNHSVVEAAGHMGGPLAELLDTVQTSHIAALTHGALDAASAEGTATLQLALTLPIDSLEQSSVSGSVTLTGNKVRLLPETPVIGALRGVVQFNENGFTLEGVHGEALGGPIALSGGMRVPQEASKAGKAGDAGVDVRAQGRASAAGLRQETASALAPLAALARYASGEADWAMRLGLQRGVPQLEIETDLHGMAFDLPAPLGKVAEARQSVRFSSRLTAAAAASERAPLHDLLAIDLDGMGNLAWERDVSSPVPRVRAGAITLGLAPEQQSPLEPAKWPQSGVAAHVEFGVLDLDAWRTLLSDAAAGTGQAAEQGTASDYLPGQLAVRAAALTLEGRTVRDLVLGLSRDGQVWRANIESDALGGYLEYHPGGQGRSTGTDNALLHARLTRLALPLSTEGNTGAQDTTLLDESDISQLPALDIVVDDFELRGQSLGRLEIQASNRAQPDTGQRQWQLEQFNLVTPEASLTSAGLWALRAAQTGTEGAEAAATLHKQTSLNFHLDIHDAGSLLARLGMEGVLRRGQGQLEGDIHWIGSPLSPDWRSMDGALRLDMESGQFLKADPGLAKLLSVLSLQSLPRRLALDFRDVFSEGFAFDFIRGDVQIAQGIASTNNLQMKGVNAAVLMEGSANIEHETQQLRVIVVPEINAMTASLAATAINPVAGLGSFLAQMFLRGPLMEAATHEFRVDGTWSDPHVERVRRGTPPAAAAPADRPAPTTEMPLYTE